MRASTVEPSPTRLHVWVTCAALLTSCVIQSRLTFAQQAPLERCSERESIWVAPAESMVKIAVSHPAVACAFRHKDEGFPSFNIVTTPQLKPSAGGSQRAWEARILESYHSIGLVDATVATPGVAAISEFHAPSAVIHYVNRGTSMSALVTEIEADDRAYTLTALDRADHFTTSRLELEKLIRSVVVRGKHTTPSHRTASRGVIIATCVVLLLLVLIAVGYRQRGRS